MEQSIKTTGVHVEIFKQLGGNKFLAMTGSKNFIYCEKENNYLQMELRRNKIGAQFLKITLNVMDTYTMVFTKLQKKDHKYEVIEVCRKENVYNDMLQTVFTDVTGLNTHL